MVVPVGAVVLVGGAEDVEELVDHQAVALKNMFVLFIEIDCRVLFSWRKFGMLKNVEIRSLMRGLFNFIGYSCELHGKDFFQSIFFAIMQNITSTWFNRSHHAHWRHQVAVVRPRSPPVPHSGEAAGPARVDAHEVAVGVPFGGEANAARTGGK